MTVAEQQRFRPVDDQTESRIQAVIARTNNPATTGRENVRSNHPKAVTKARLIIERKTSPDRRSTPFFHGDERIRTADPLLAKQMLYQLSYIPERPALFVPPDENPTRRAGRGSANRRSRARRREYGRLAGA